MDSLGFPFGSYAEMPADLDYRLMCPYSVLPTFEFRKTAVAGYQPFTGPRETLKTAKWWSQEQACQNGLSQSLYLLERIRNMVDACPEVHILDRFVCGKDRSQLCRLCVQINSVINFHYCGNMSRPGSCTYCDDKRERRGLRVVSGVATRASGSGGTPRNVSITTEGNVCSVLEALCRCRKEQVEHLADIKTSSSKHSPCVFVLPISEIISAGYNSYSFLHQTVLVIDYRPVIKLDAHSTSVGAVTSSSSVRLIYYDPYDYGLSKETPRLCDEVRLVAGLFGVKTVDLVTGQQIESDDVLCVGHGLWAIYRLAQGMIPGDQHVYGVSIDILVDFF